MGEKMGIWFPTVRTGTGTDAFTERLVEGLQSIGIQAEIHWLPLRAEYLPHTVTIPIPPKWVDIVHVNTWLPIRFIPKDLPIIATIHNSIHDPKVTEYKGLLRTIYHKFWIKPNEQKIFKRATSIIAVSNHVANITNKYSYNIPVHVIYNGIDTTKYKPKYQEKYITYPIKLLYVGAWKKLKGVDILIKVMEELGDNYVLYYTGGENSKKDKKNMPPNMFDLGRLTQSQVIQAMQNTNGFLFFSQSEGLPLAVLEAMSCGLPIIGSKIPPLQEIINKNTGLLTNEISTIISFLKTNPDLLNTMGISARDYAEKNFSIQYMLNCYIEQYNKIYLSRNEAKK